MDNQGKNLDSTNVGGSKKNESSSVMVKTLDGRVVPKSEIADGEIYINEQGKKVRKVVKKVVKTKILPKSAEQSQVESMYSGVNKPSDAIKDSPAGKELDVKKANSAVLPQPINVPKQEQSVASENSVPEVAVRDASERSNEKSNNFKASTDNREPKQETFMDRISAKHSFLLRMQNNGKVSSLNNRGTSFSVVDKNNASPSINQNGIVEEAIQPDSAVTELENAVVKENYDYSVGKGSSVAKGTGKGSSNVSGAAYNPNGSVLNSPVSNANNKISQGLAGNYVVATPIVKSKKKKKKTSFFKPWFVIVPLVLVYFIVALVYFIGKYNFGDKSVNVGLYYVNVGANAKLKYYDGEPFNWRDLAMTYFFGNDNIKEFDLGKINFVEPDEYSGYTIQEDGGICAVWDGIYKDADYRPVDVVFKHENQVCKVRVTIYRNKVSKLSTYSALEEVKAGAKICPVVRGVYTNEVMVEEGIGYLPKQLTTDEYDLVFSYHDGAQYVSAIIAPDASGMFTLPKILVLPDREILIDYSAKEKIRIMAVAKNDKNVWCDVYQYYNLDTAEVDAAIGSIVKVTSDDSIGTSLETNRPVKFRVKLNEGYTFSDGGVFYTVTSKADGAQESEKYELLPNEEGVYCLRREVINGNIKLYLEATNKYTINFNGVGEYQLTYLDAMSSLLGSEEGKVPIQTKENYIFNGWYTEQTGGVQVITGENVIINNCPGITDESGNFIATKDITLYPRFTAKDYTVSLQNKGMKIMRGANEWTTFSASDTSATFYFEISEELSAINTNFNNVAIQSNTYGSLFKVYYKTSESENWTLITFTGKNSSAYLYNIKFNGTMSNLEFKVEGIKYPISVLNENDETNPIQFNVINDNDEALETVYSVEKQENIKFTINLATGYVKTSEYKVLYKIADDSYTELTADGDGYYQISKDKLWGSLTIKVVGVTRCFAVTTEGEHFEVVQLDGKTTFSQINENTEMKFAINVKAGYEADSLTYKVEYKVGDGDYVVLSGEDVDGVVIYTIGSDKITNNITIKVSGIVASTGE